MPASIWDLFGQRADEYSDRPFLCLERHSARAYGRAEGEWSYSDVLAATKRLVQIYADMGCRAGVRVAFALDNRPEFFQHFLALNALGASVVPLNAGMTIGELSYQLQHSEAGLIVSDREHLTMLASAISDWEMRPVLMAAGDMGRTACPQPVHSEFASGEAALLYTSGTTGKPKGCLLSNEYFLHIAKHYVGLGGYCTFRPGAERIITPLPVTHMNALACSFMAAIESGACLVQLDRFHPSAWWESVRGSHATIMHYLGVMPAMLLGAPENAVDNVSGQVKFGFGAGCDPRHQARFEARFGVPLIEAWAMTETGAGAWITAQHEPRHIGARCFGRAPNELDWRTVDEAGADVPAGEPGELLVRRARSAPRQYFFSGYLKDTQATEEAWAGGWFHTGDVVRADEGGNFYFVDRRKNVIRRSGENIAAIEIESALMRHEGVAGCAVAPVVDEMRGEEVAALIVAKRRPDETLAVSIFAHAMQHLAYYKAPAYVVFADAMPLTASEKVKRGEVKQLLREAVATGACYDFRSIKKRPSGQ